MSSRRNPGGSRPSDSTLVLLIAVAMVSFFAGTIFTAHMNMDCVHGDGGSDHHFIDVKVEELAQRRVAALLQQRSKPPAEKPVPSLVQFPETTKNYAQGMARTSKTDFFEHFDIGVPFDVPKSQDSDVLLLYNHEQTFPENYKDPSMITDDSSIPQLETKDAVEHCDNVNVILSNHGGKSKKQCTAIVPNYESYHIQKWLRLGENGIDSTKEFKLVSRGIMEKNGHDTFNPPRAKHIYANWEILKTYFDAFEDAVEELKPLAEKAATPKNTVTVMVSNFGQSELLVNFVCAARARNHDISSIIVFATDAETKALAEGLGLLAFYDKRNYGDIPSEAAGRYGDKKFTAMMMAKVMCVQMVSSLGYNILFQDVDIVWYKNPIPFFETERPELEEFDMMFQDDGGHSTRYAPYSANSGFYYVRANARTQFFFASLLTGGDVILETNSHQQALIALLSEHVSLYGLKVKIFDRETDEFPGGFHYHQKSGQYMRKLIKGEVDPYIFHMSWTYNKENKLLFFKQMEEWYVHDQCLHKKPEDIPVENGDFAAGCCLPKPVFGCSYRDKPSKHPCYDSPPIDKDGKSFWKKDE